jgi:hypothetical protein
VKQRVEINRRQFLTGAFRRRDAASSKTGAISAATGDLAREEFGEHCRSVRGEEPQIPDWDDGLERVLEEMENLKGIEDF